jgi:flagellar hook protein FlgE
LPPPPLLSFALSKLDQDGRESVSVTGYGIDDSGNFFASYSDGLQESTGKLSLANFKSPENLVAVTGNLYAATLESGPAAAALANANTSNGRLGLLKSRTLSCPTSTSLSSWWR